MSDSIEGSSEDAMTITFPKGVVKITGEADFVGEQGGKILKIVIEDHIDSEIAKGRDPDEVREEARKMIADQLDELKAKNKA